MKTFRVILKDNREFCVDAKTDRHEGEQYVFEGEDDFEVQFFQGEVLAGIIIVPADTSRPVEQEYI